MLHYTTEENIEKYLTITIDDAQMSARISAWIGAVSRFADKYCNRTLMVENSDTRKFSGQGTATLHIDEAAEIVSVTPDGGDALDLADLVEYPLNRGNILALRSKNGYFERGMANYDVEAYFGYMRATGVTNQVPDNVPDELQLAVTMLVAGIVNLSRKGGDNVQSEKVGIYSYTVKDLESKEDYKIATGMLDQFRRLAI